MPHAGGQRRYVLRMPARCDNPAQLPLLLNLHGSTSYPEEQLWLSGLGRTADTHGLAIIAPEAQRRAWNTPYRSELADDTLFITAAVEHATRLLGQSGQPLLFATGFSGGARMLSQLVSRQTLPLTAIAAVAGVRTIDASADLKPPALVAFHGLLDQVNPYAGGGQPYWQTGVEHAIGGWARALGATHLERQQSSPGVEHQRFTDGHRRLELYTVADLGHHWPGCPQALGAPFDPPSQACQASEVMVDFFRREHDWSST